MGRHLHVCKSVSDCERSCSDQIATLRIIIEQSIEWNTPVYVNFIDFEKAFDSVDRKLLWNLMAHYGIPPKYINIIKNTYQDMQCQVLLLCIDWTMKQTTHNKNTDIQWSLTEQLEDLDFADDIALFSHSHQQMREKSQLLETTAAGLGLKINGAKNKIMRINNKSMSPINIGDQTLEDVIKCTYLG